MLAELRIQDFAIIEEVSLRLGSGFVVFTGETGAGKSIIIDAVEMLLGGRSESGMIRTGASAALIEGAFQVDPSDSQDLRLLLDREGLLDDPATVTLGREIRREGRSICRVNGRTVSLGLMKGIGELLVDVHGQSEHLSLLRVKEHLSLLDRYAESEPLRQEYREAYECLVAVRRELVELREREHDAARRSEMLAYQIDEIRAASLRPGEEATLVAERSRLANAEQLADLAGRAISALDESVDESAPASDLLGQAAEALALLAKVDSSLEGTHAEAQALVEQAGDLARRLRVYRDEIEFNSKRLDEVEERIALIRGLTRKYGGSEEAALAHGGSAEQELETITHAEERIRELTSQEATALRWLGEIGARLSRARQEEGKRLAAAVEGELADLRMAGARFGVDFQWKDEAEGVPLGERRVAFGATGLDQVEFLVAPNPGEGLKPLVKIASGGETSRLMLGLKGVLARADRTPTLIFDEIDQGIGGRVGAIVGRKLWGLARAHQVLCVTHLPQLAAYGDQHFRVEKQVKRGRTVTMVGPMSEAERAEELASMLGGVSEANRQSASDLLHRAAEEKGQKRP
jgi:DNA repair protein RecN (Recombination protein N)